MIKSFSTFLEKFRRITSAGNYIPEIDGLRFVAIFWVVVWLHLPGLMNTHLFNGTLFSGTYIPQVITEGGQGVSFFFMISGFILALPFIKEKNAGSRVSLKKYYLRRLTRLEPPYLAVLVISFILLVVVKKGSFSDLLPHFGASAVYMHNIIYGGSSPVLGVAWSLEVEVQFYLLAPFLCFIFLVKQKTLRHIVLLLLIVLSGVFAFNNLWTMPVILPYFLCYFLSGMLLADLYSTGHQSALNNISGLLIGIVILLGLPFLISLHSVGMFLLKLFLMITAFYLVLFNDGLKKWMSRQIITIVGGMCYSIYLLHVLIMSAVSQGLAKITIWQGALAAVVYGLILLTSVLLVNAVFYRLVEQPCMRRDWWKRRFVKKSE